MSAALTDALLEARRSVPDLRVLFITDPANESYGAARSPELQLLRAAGVEVVLADLDRLRDSNLAVFEPVATRPALVGHARARWASRRGASTSRATAAGS